MRDKSLKRVVCLLTTLAVPAFALETEKPDEAAELAKQLANPVAALISVPFQVNYDKGMGPDGEGSKSLLNIQPVTPFSLGGNWNLVLRTIVPVASQEDVVPGTEQFGLGDILQSFFLTPKDPVGGWVLAAGPVALYPSATDEALGGEKWGAGSTILALKQDGPWSYGVLANHVWSVGGQNDRADISATFVQPFVTYITKTKTTLALSTESTYDWENEQWSVPVNLMALQLLKIGKHLVQVGVGPRYWAESGDNGPEGWGARAVVTFLFPK